MRIKRKSIQIGLLILGFSMRAFAANGETIQYTLTDLKPKKITKYDLPENGIKRKYILLQNRIGNHYLIYDESVSAPPLTELLTTDARIKSGSASCRLQLSCKMHAFCTGDCKNFYYELSNTAPDPSKKSRNFCKVNSFQCAEAHAAEAKK